MFEDLETASFLIQAVVAFGGGVVSFISPCVLPLLPGYLSMMSGYSASDLDSGAVERGRMLRVILLFIAGFTLVFAAIGAGATSLGNLLRHNLGTLTQIAGIVIVVFGLLMVALAVTNRGLFGFLQRERRVEVRPSRLGSLAPPVMGMAFGFGWTPCIGPILTVILAFATTQETVGRGIGLLVAFSLGLGVPFLFAGLGLHKVFGRLKPYLRTINIVSGVVLAGFGVVMALGYMGRLSSFFSRIIINIPFLEDLATI